MFSLKMKNKSSIIFADTMEATIVEGAIERHKSRPTSRETGDGLTRTYSGGNLDRTESVPRWSRDRRTRAGLRETLRRDKAVCSSSLSHSLYPEIQLVFCNHIIAQILITFSDRVVPGELDVFSTPYPKPLTIYLVPSTLHGQSVHTPICFVDRYNSSY